MKFRDDSSKSVVQKIQYRNRFAPLAQLCATTYSRFLWSIDSRLLWWAPLGWWGQQMLAVLEEQGFPVKELVAVASPRSAGRRRSTSKGRRIQWSPSHPRCFEGVDVALFSAGGGTSREWSPIAASKGAVVVDNSSAFRTDPEVPLVVPEGQYEGRPRSTQGHHRQPQLLHHPNGGRAQAVARCGPAQACGGVRPTRRSAVQAPKRSPLLKRNHAPPQMVMS